MQPTYLSLALLGLSATAYGQGYVHEQPMSPGGGVVRSSQLWIDPSGQNDSDMDAIAWEDFQFPYTVTIDRVRWWGQAAPPLGFEISFFHQDPNTVAVQPDIFAAGSHAISEEVHTSFTSVPVGGGLYRFEVELATALTFDANTRYFVSVVGRTTQPFVTWGWAQGTGGVNGTFWWQRGAHMYFHLGDDRALGLATSAGWSVGSAFGLGDGSGAPCPCGNPGQTGQGCASSSGTGATLAGFGTADVALDDLSLTARQLLPGRPALLFVGTQALVGGSGLAFGDGLRAAGGSVERLGVRVPDPGGNATWGPGLRSIGAWSAGDVRFFQVWYRDPVGSPCGSGFNLSGGLEVHFGL